MSYSDDDTALTLTLLDQIPSLDTILIAINGIEDWAGNISNTNDISFYTFLLEIMTKTFILMFTMSLYLLMPGIIIIFKMNLDQYLVMSRT